MANPIAVEVSVAKDRQTTWDLFTNPEHIVKWAAASDDWHTTTASNDLTVGGIFESHMEAKDGSGGFDLIGTYSEVTPGTSYTYQFTDGRNVSVTMTDEEGGTHIVETFDQEFMNSREKQHEGWQAILDNFKKYAESV